MPKLNSIINRYIFKSLLAPFLICIAFITFIFLMAEMLKITDMVVNYGIGLIVILKILVYSTPFFLMYVIPMATMMAVLLTFLRLSGENEIIALKAGGVSLYRLLPPVLTFCLIASLLSFFMAVYGFPRGRQAIKTLTFEVISSNLDIGLKERTFNDSFDGVMLYINRIDVKNRTLIDVFIEDKRNEKIVSTVIAPRGRLFGDPDNLVFHLKLYDGVINQVGLAKRSVHSVAFDSYDIRLDMKKAAAVGAQKGHKEMGVTELRELLKRLPEKNAYYHKVVMVLQKKFSIPTACFALGILAVPLGIQPRRTKRSSGLVLGLFFFLFYYILLSLGLVFGETGVYPPALAMWVPNLVMGTLGLFLLVRAADERPVRIGFINRKILRLIYRPVRKQA